MESKVIYNQRFKKSVADVRTLLNEFENLMSGNYPAEDKQIKIQLLKNEFKTATNSVLEEVEDTTGKSAVTILTELSRDDLDTIRNAVEVCVDIATFKDEEISDWTQFDADLSPYKIAIEARNLRAIGLLEKFSRILSQLKNRDVFN